jgi:hypothetical protein
LVYSTGDKFDNNDAITRILNRIFNKKIGSSMLRNIYLTDKFGDENKAKKETATAMGTSVNMLDNNYIKTDN